MTVKIFLSMCSNIEQIQLPLHNFFPFSATFLLKIIPLKLFDASKTRVTLSKVVVTVLKNQQKMIFYQQTLRFPETGFHTIGLSWRFGKRQKYVPF